MLVCVPLAAALDNTYVSIFVDLQILKRAVKAALMILRNKNKNKINKKLFSPLNKNTFGVF